MIKCKKFDDYISEAVDCITLSDFTPKYGEENVPTLVLAGIIAARFRDMFIEHNTYWEVVCDSHQKANKILLRMRTYSQSKDAVYVNIFFDECSLRIFTGNSREPDASRQSPTIIDYKDAWFDISKLSVKLNAALKQAVLTANSLAIQTKPLLVE